MIRRARQVILFALPVLSPFKVCAQVEQEEATAAILAALDPVGDRIPPGAALASTLTGSYHGKVPNPALLISDVANRFGYEIREVTVVSGCIAGKPVLLGTPALIQLAAPERSGHGRREVVIGWTFSVGGSSAGKSVWLELEHRNGRWTVIADLGEERTSLGCRPPGR